jgi:hypothetical protein
MDMLVAADVGGLKTAEADEQPITGEEDLHRRDVPSHRKGLDMSQELGSCEKLDWGREVNNDHTG